MTTVPRPITKLTDEQRRLLDVAVESARKSGESTLRAAADKEGAWRDIITARGAGVPDDLLCRETGFSRATLNRRFGARPDGDEGEPAMEN